MSRFVPYTERHGQPANDEFASPGQVAMIRANLAIGQLCVNMIEGRDPFLDLIDGDR